MRIKAFVVILSILLVIPLYSVTKIERLGIHPFMKKRVITPQDLRNIEKYETDLKAGFELAGASELLTPFVEEIKAGRVWDAGLKAGDTVKWMLFKEKGKVKVVTDGEIAIKKPIKAYRVSFYKDLKTYDFVIPSICANISLMNVTEHPAPECYLEVSPVRIEVGNPVILDLCKSKNWVKGVIKIILGGKEITTIEATKDDCKKTFTANEPGNYKFEATVYEEHGAASTNPCVASVDYWKNLPPQCDLKISPEKVLTGEEITLDASGSSDPEGKLSGVKFTIKSDGNVVEEKTITETPYIYKLKPSKAGSFKVELVAIDDQNEISSVCEGSYNALRRGFIMVESGLMSQADPRLFIPLRLGYQYRINQTYRVAGLLGYTIKIKGNSDDDEYGNPITLDALFLYYPEKFWFGGGVGFWGVKNESNLDLIGKAGYEFYSTENLGFSLFVEGRFPFVNFDEKSDRGVVLLGMNVRF
ncbi:MAG: hypothetical protein ACUVUG_05595 [Candidatus Aminicenantia bacterium]